MRDGGGLVAVDNQIIVVEIASEDCPISRVVLLTNGEDVGYDFPLEVGQSDRVVLVDVYDEILVNYCKELFLYCVGRGLQGRGGPILRGGVLHDLGKGDSILPQRIRPA